LETKIAKITDFYACAVVSAGHKAAIAIIRGYLSGATRSHVKLSFKNYCQFYLILSIIVLQSVRILEVILGRSN
jgi:hypothetical protein